MKTPLLSIFALLILSVSLVGAQERIVVGGMDGLDPTDNSKQYPILLALSGGGARGLSSIGVLKAFEEKGIKPIAIAGTSMGAIVGGLYASGYSASRLAGIVHNIDFAEVFSNRPSRRTMFLTQRQQTEKHILAIRFDGLRPVIPKGLTAGQKLTNLLTRFTLAAGYHSRGDFLQLPIPFRAVCTDMISGEPIIVGSGSLASTMRASMGFPLAFTPLDSDKRLLMDGGLVKPVPVDVVRAMADSGIYIVAVNTTSPLRLRSQLTTAVDIANQATTIMTAERLTNQLELADYVIEPRIDEFQSTDFKYSDSLIEIGHAAGLSAADSIISTFDSRHHEQLYDILTVQSENCPTDVSRILTDRLQSKSVSRSDLVRILKNLTVEHNLFRLDAIIHTIHITDQHRSSVSLTVIAEPAPTVASVSFQLSGNATFSRKYLLSQLIIEDTLLTPSGLRDGLNHMLRPYRTEGYHLAHVSDLEVDLEAGVVRIKLDEAIVREIQVTGNERTRSWFVRSLLPITVDRPYSSGGAAQGLRNVYATDLFDRITFDIAHLPDGAKVILDVEEKKYTQVRLGWHWDRDFESEEFIEILDDNIAGMGLSFLSHAQYGPSRQYYSSGLKMDRIWFTHLTASIKASHSRLTRQIYNDDGESIAEREELKTSGEIRLGQQIARLGTVSVAVGLSEIELTDTKTDHRTMLGLRTLKIQSLVETFDRMPIPTEGKKHLFDLQFAGKVLQGDIEYTRFFTSIEAYFPLGRYLNYHPKFLVGVSRSGLPETEQFYLGGLHSLAGYRTHQLVGDKVILLSNELRLKLPLRLYLSVRYDLGDVYNGADQIKATTLVHAIAAVLKLDFPLGPIEFGYGYADTEQEEVYFHAGLAF